MSKLGLIISREYMTRVKNKMFLVSTILGPLFLTAITVVPIILAIYGQEARTVLVKDDSGLVAPSLKDQKDLNYVVFTGTDMEAKAKVTAEEADGVLFIPKTFSIDTPKGVTLYSADQLGAGLIDDLQSTVENRMYSLRLARSGIDSVKLKQAEVKIDLPTYTISDEGAEKEKDSSAATIVALFIGLLMYIFIFLYGMQVLQGVVEEKANRVVEVIISSVKPFDLMMGKILGIAAVGLTQFALWIVLTAGLTAVAKSLIPTDQMSKAATAQAGAMGSDAEAAAQMGGAGKFDGILEAMGTLDLVPTIIAFILFFLGGYLFYASLFAAVGGAVDQQSDAQSLLGPITMPIIIGLIVSQVVVQNPGSPLGFWFGIVPFTSPIVMAAQLPFKENVFDWETILSLVLLYGGFIGTTWIGSRIYRTGILLYGKKPTLKELLKWTLIK